jgi:hypothetical protein
MKDLDKKLQTVIPGKDMTAFPDVAEIAFRTFLKRLRAGKSDGVHFSFQGALIMIVPKDMSR